MSRPPSAASNRAVSGATSGCRPWRPGPNSRMSMLLNDLKRKATAGEIDTVLVVFPDVYGRLIGKRVTAHHFINSIATHGTHGCNYLLTVDMEMEPVPGYKL